MNNNPIAFILSWERPIYLWNCLDSLYRLTQKPIRFIIADNNSQDPMIKQIIQSFEARGMFDKVHLYNENDPKRLQKLIELYNAELGDYFYFIESDVEIIDNGTCWATEYSAIHTKYQRMAMIGSTCYKHDFINLEQAQKAYPTIPPKQLKFLIKHNSIERTNKPPRFKQIFDPHNPPGRLMLLDTKAILKHGVHSDSMLYKTLKQQGYKACIATKVQHRHLSLLNLYDNPEYDAQHRHDFFQKMNKL